MAAKRKNLDIRKYFSKKPVTEEPTQSSESNGDTRSQVTEAALPCCSSDRGEEARSQVRNIAVSHTFKIDKARRDLGYSPKPYSLADSVEQYLKSRPPRNTSSLFSLSWTSRRRLFLLLLMGFSVVILMLCCVICQN